MPLPLTLRYLARVHGKYNRKPPRRYRTLLKEIRRQHSKSILEIGVYRGIRSVEMIETAALSHKPKDIRYIGFDLFEDLTDELCTKEFSKKPFRQAEIEQMLRATGAQIELHK